jgi:hypothetical protein
VSSIMTEAERSLYVTYLGSAALAGGTAVMSMSTPIPIAPTYANVL